MISKASEDSSYDVVKDVFVHASINEEGENECIKQSLNQNLTLLDELEMKLEWTNVEMRKKKWTSWDHIEHKETGTQTVFPKYKKELSKMKAITPTPKSPFQKYNFLCEIVVVHI